MKVVCDKCGEIMNGSDKAEISVEYPFDWAIIQKKDIKYFVCKRCADALAPRIKEMFE
jgi:RNase P subunit RPR2